MQMAGGNIATEFSPDGKLFACINSQGILTVWDTETNELKQEYTPNLHLSAPCTSLTWILVNTQKQNIKDKQKKGRKSLEAAQGSQLYIAFGTSKGGVELYSYSSAKIERNLEGEGHSSRVANIISDGGDFLYTCGEDGKVVVWSISEEKEVGNWLVGNEKPKTLLYLPKSKSLVVGCRQLKQYSTANQELLNTFTGHSSEVTLLKTFEHEDVEYVLSASQMDRVLNLWSIKKSSKYKNAIATFLMEDVAYNLSCRVLSEEVLQVVAVTRSGVAHFYVKNLDSFKADKPIKPKVTIEIASENITQVEPISVVAASFEQCHSQEEFVIGYGDSHLLSFERLTPNLSEKRQILIRNNAKNLQQKNANKKAENNLKVLTPIVSADDVEYQTGTVIPRKHHKAVEIPMETRLENISITKGETPHSLSKAQLLVQALRNQDASLLRTVLSHDDKKVVNVTLQKLPIQYVGALVSELTALMQKKRMHVQTAVLWLKVLVRVHSSQLMALGKDELLDKFGPCLGIIEQRQNCLKELSRASGRLDLLVNQIKRNSEEDNIKDDNLLVYIDAESSTSDVDENPVNNESSSDDDWAEENDSDEEMDVSDKE